MTLRQVWVRIKALPPEAPLRSELRREVEEAEDEQRRRDLDSALSPYQRGGDRGD